MYAAASQITVGLDSSHQGTMNKVRKFLILVFDHSEKPGKIKESKCSVHHFSYNIQKVRAKPPLTEKKSKKFLI